MNFDGRRSSWVRSVFLDMRVCAECAAAAIRLIVKHEGFADGELSVVKPSTREAIFPRLPDRPGFDVAHRRHDLTHSPGTIG
jgi:hypothetical protein